MPIIMMITMMMMMILLLAVAQLLQPHVAHDELTMMCRGRDRVRGKSRARNRQRLRSSLSMWDEPRTKFFNGVKIAGNTIKNLA